MTKEIDFDSVKRRDVIVYSDRTPDFVILARVLNIKHHPQHKTMLIVEDFKLLDCTKIGSKIELTEIKKKKKENIILHNFGDVKIESVVNKNPEYFV